MSSSQQGYDEDGDDEILLYPPLPPHLEPPFTSFLGHTQQDLSLFFRDNDDFQNNPSSLLEDRVIVTDQTIDQLGQGQTNEDLKDMSSCSLTTRMMKKKKKMDHNEKERVRRLQLNMAYLALRSLLPDQPHKPKKKWSAPYLIDRAVNHIPKIEIELERLKSKKKDLLLTLEKAHHLKPADETAEKQDTKPPSISISEVGRGDVIIQICHQLNQVGVFSELLHKLESEGMAVLGASVSNLSEEASCHHIHVQMEEGSIGADYVAGFKEKLITWLV